MIRDLVLALSFLCALGPAVAGAEPRRLADGTTADRWTLPNGLEVVTRDVPGAYAASVTWGYRLGLDHDPADRPGLASLLAEVAFTAAAGDVPARTRDEMESLRPQGWSLRVNRRQSLFTEGATPAQLPGVLHQIATRMAGVTVTDETLAAAFATVRRSLGEKAFGSVDQMLANQPRAYAAGADAEAIVNAASARALQRVTAAEVSAALARHYVAANGVLAITGDFSTFDVRAVVTSEFGGLAPGARTPDPAPARLDSAAVVLVRPEATRPRAALLVLAPALGDSTHPAFYMAMLGLGAFCRSRWGSEGGGFHYALLDDPEVVRFHPPVQAGAASLAAARQVFDDAVKELLDAIPTPEVFDTYRHGTLWLMGGPLPTELAQRMKIDSPALNVLSGSIASQALWGSDEFWERYRARTDRKLAKSLGTFAGDLLDPKRQSVLLVLPKR